MHDVDPEVGMPKQDLFQQKRIAQRRTIPRVTLVRVDATHSHMKGDWNIQLFSERKVRLKKRIAGCQSLGLSYNFSQHRYFSFHHKVPYPLHFVFARMAEKKARNDPIRGCSLPFPHQFNRPTGHSQNVIFLQKSQRSLFVILLRNRST